jgi:hypothetical protein
MKYTNRHQIPSKTAPKMPKFAVTSFLQSSLHHCCVRAAGLTPPSSKGFEAAIIAKQLDNYDWQSSPVWNKLRRQFSSGVRQPELQSIAHILCGLTGALSPPSRSEKRSFPLMIRWFDVNWATIGPWMTLIDLRDEHANVINFKRERAETMRHLSQETDDH